MFAFRLAFVSSSSFLLIVLWFFFFELLLLFSIFLQFLQVERRVWHGGAEIELAASASSAVIGARSRAFSLFEGVRAGPCRFRFYVYVYMYLFLSSLGFSFCCLFPFLNLTGGWGEMRKTESLNCFVSPWLCFDFFFRYCRRIVCNFIYFYVDVVFVSWLFVLYLLMRGFSWNLCDFRPEDTGSLFGYWAFVDNRWYDWSYCGWTAPTMSFWWGNPDSLIRR